MKEKSANRWLFLIRFVFFFALTYVIWDLTAPIGARLLGGISGEIVMAVDRADYTKDVKFQGKYMIFGYQPAEDGKPLILEYKGFTFNTVLLVALIMAVPKVKYKLRLKILLLGLVILFPIQVFRLVIYVFNYYCLNMRRRSGAFIYPAYLHHSIGYVDKILIRIDGQIIPVIIWGALYYYYKWHYIFSNLRKEKAALS